MDATVVVCTRNRSRLLEGTLESLTRQTLDAARYEVLVVDNASSDATADTAVHWARSAACRCRIVREDSIGLNHARNRGITESGAETVVFLDDDARAEPQWLESLLSPLRRGPATGVGGKIELACEAPMPSWIHRSHRRLLAEFDLGPEPCPVERYPFLVGTNMAFRAEAFRRFGGFDPTLDRAGTNLLSAGDTEFCRRVVEGGGKLVYEPRAVVRHFVPAERVRLRFLLRRSYDQGRSVCRYHRIGGEHDRPASRPIAVVRRLTELPGPLVRGDLRECARVVTSIAWYLGYLRESRRPD